GTDGMLLSSDRIGTCQAVARAIRARSRLRYLLPLQGCRLEPQTEAMATELVRLPQPAPVGCGDHLGQERRGERAPTRGVPAKVETLPRGRLHQMPLLIVQSLRNPG